jgi:hypothetical protein
MDPKEYRFYTIITGYYLHTSLRDNTKKRQELQEIYFIALL